ncbi:hypothetical protein [Mycoplasma sp. 1654_15]|uniref:hypothetical protein n=1 Tax=Mycoplasma sp. 1654_15 TaxID=2725994 RepID=UPI001448B489|nr:hypothetical protein [Mycoplasma sp. 1654_15]QJB71200.1 hypothetical protein HF996_01745 [Mycoplasma sp. 1654_15]
MKNKFQSRAFNSIELVENNLIFKSSFQTDKLFSEWNWYKNLPSDLNKFGPEVFDFKFAQNKQEFSGYYMSFIDGYNLASLLVNKEYDESFWKSIVDKCLEILFNFTIIL